HTVGDPSHYGRLLVAAEFMEIATVLHRSPGIGLWRDRPCLLDGSDGQARGDPAASGFRQQYRAAAFLSVRADRLRARSADRGVADARRVRAPVRDYRRAADPESVARALQGARRMAVGLFLPRASAVNPRDPLLRARARRRRADDCRPGEPGPDDSCRAVAGRRWLSERMFISHSRGGPS